MALLVKLLGKGIGLASEAIHAARDNDRSEASSRTSSTTVAAGSNHSLSPAGAPPSELAGDGPVMGRARDKSDSDDSDSVYSLDLNDDEAVWELDELAGRVAPPGHAKSEHAPQSEEHPEAKRKRAEAMVRELVGMVAPPPPSYTTTGSLSPAIPCPVVIPQRRPRQRDRGFVRAYAPVLGECGIGQDTFLKFLDDWIVASKSDPWIDVVYLSANIVGFVPEAAAQIVSTAVSIAAGTAREVQTRSRRNTYLDMVNQQVFMPRGLFAMIMAFKDDDEMPAPAQGRRPIRSLVSQLVTTERLDLNQTATKYATADSSSKVRNLRVASGKTVGALELPQAAELVYPDVDRAVRQELSSSTPGEAGNGKDKSFKDKMAGSVRWLEDYMDRREQAFYAAEHAPDSHGQQHPLAVPSSARKPLVSRFNDPNHPANSGSLIALLTGGAVVSRRGERMARRRERLDVRRVARGREPRERRGGGGGDGATPRRERRGIVRKLLTQDVLYLVVVNLPTREEVEDGERKLEEVLGHGGVYELAA